MKTDKIKSELRQLDVQVLRDRLKDAKKALLNLRLTSSTQHDVKDYSQFKKIRKDIARIKTFLNSM